MISLIRNFLLDAAAVLTIVLFACGAAWVAYAATHAG
jgi:hypothetical protein